MSIDKSLKRKATTAANRSVLKRVERITMMKDEEKWKEGMGPYGLPKYRVTKLVIKKKAKKAAEGEGAEGAAAGAAAAPDAKAAAAPKKEEKKK